MFFHLLFFLREHKTEKWQAMCRSQGPHPFFPSNQGTWPSCGLLRRHAPTRREVASSQVASFCCGTLQCCACALSAAPSPQLNTIPVVNRAQRCELHNLTCSGGWEGQRVESCCGHFGSRATLRATLKSCDRDATACKVGCSCQACDAGLESQNGGQWGCSLDNWLSAVRWTRTRSASG